MAGSVKAVDDLSAMLREKSYPAAERELEELKAYAKEKGHEGDLALWDVTYWRVLRFAAVVVVVGSGGGGGGVLACCHGTPHEIPRFLRCDWVQFCRFQHRRICRSVQCR